MAVTLEHGVGLATTVAGAVAGENGVLVHRVESPFQHDETSIHVIQPHDAGETCPVLYVLPVAPHGHAKWGDPVATCLQNDLANRHGVACVVPTFSNMPWYADNPTDRRMLQETYFLEVVLPFVERTYSVLAERAGRLLLGFSKSGWGAWSLLLRHPETFERAGAWDAPLGQQAPNKYGMSEVFSTYDSIDPYCIWELLAERAESLACGPARLGLFRYDVFRAHHQATHHHLLRLDIPHVYVDGPRREHVWGSGWVGGVAEFAISGIVNDPSPAPDSTE